MDEKRSQQAEEHSSRRSSSVISSRLHLGGIKFSEVQTHVSFVSPADPANLGRLISALSKHKINLNRLLLNRGAGSINDFSIDRLDYQRNSTLIEHAFDSLSIPLACDQPTGTITLFPHGSELNRLLGVMETVERYNLQVSGIYSSLSAISVCTGYDQLDRVADLLGERFELPAGHSPFRYEPSELDQQLRSISGRKVETVAQYWEPRIKIYGSTLKQRMHACALNISTDAFGDVVSALSKSCPVSTFQMFSLVPERSRNNYTMLLVVDLRKDLHTWELFCQQLNRIGGVRSDCKPVDVLYLHGPHFQDRYGVAALAVAALDKGSIDFSCLNCTGTSIFLVAKADEGEKALESLAEVFIVP